MAIDDPDDDLEQEEEGKKPKKKRGVLKIIIFFFVFVLLIGGSVGGTLYFTGALTSATDTEQDEDKSAKKDSKKKRKKSDEGPPSYLAFDPAFIVNFIENNQIRYLQVTVEVMSHDEIAIEDVKTHMPLIRNNLIMLFSNQSYETLSSPAGMQRLRAEALAEVQKILKEETGDSGIEALYFTSYVMQ